MQDTDYKHIGITPLSEKEKQAKHFFQTALDECFSNKLITNSITNKDGGKCDLIRECHWYLLVYNKFLVKIIMEN